MNNSHNACSAESDGCLSAEDREALDQVYISHLKKEIERLHQELNFAFNRIADKDVILSGAPAQPTPQPRMIPVWQALKEKMASQPSPAATVETDTSEGCRCMFCGARTLTTCTPEKPAEGCLRSRLSADKESVLLEIIGHLGAILVQAIPSDDQIIIDHVRQAHDLARELRRMP